MKMIRILNIMLGMMMFLACSDNKPKENPPMPSEKPKLILESQDTLQSIMDKILVQLTYETNIPQSQQDKALQGFESLKGELEKIASILQEAYAQNKAHALVLDKVYAASSLQAQWRMMCESVMPYTQLTPIQKLEGEIRITLALLLLHQGKDDISSLANLLAKQAQSAKGTGELNHVVEFQIQVGLLALHGLYHLQAMQYDIDTLASRQLRTGLESDLQQYKDFLPKEHYELYKRAFDLLSQEILQEQDPMDRIMQKLFLLPESGGKNIEEKSEMYPPIERVKKAYELFTLRDFSSPAAKEIIQFAQNPLKNTYADSQVENYLYGLDFLSLALLNENLSANLPLALEYLQKDFQDFQIQQHTFLLPYFQNYIASMFVGAYILSSTHQDVEYFEQLLRRIQADIAQYSDTISTDDKDLYKDMLALLEQTDRSAFLSISLAESKPKDEEGYMKIALELSPQEMQQIKDITTKEQSVPQGETLCLNPMEVEFLLSLMYQAYKIQGYEGVAPEMFKIRMSEVLGVEDLSAQGKYFVDFDRFVVVGAADRRCYKQQVHVDERLSKLQEKESICGYNLYIDKENGIITDMVLPSEILEQLANGNVYFRLKIVDFNFNKFVFQNNENALKDFVQMPYKSQILDVLLEFFPKIESYLKGRIPKDEFARFMAKEQPLDCKLH